MDAPSLAPYLLTTYWSLSHLRENEPLYSWLVTKSYAPLTIAKGKFSLDARDDERAIAPFASDFNRFASASFESVISMSQVSLSEHALAWSVVKCYYAAFFAAHAVLRLGGISVSYVDSDLASDLTRIWRSYGIGLTESIAGGSYEIRLPSKSSVMSATKRDGSGGHHAALWRAFIHFVDILVEAIADDESASRGATEYISALKSLKQVLCIDNTFGLWLTETRNAINYRQTHGVWFPYAGRDKIKFSEVSGLINNWELPADPSQIGSSGEGDLIGLFRTAIFMVAMCREFVESLAKSSGGSFVSNHSFRLLTLAKV